MKWKKKTTSVESCEIRYFSNYKTCNIQKKFRDGKVKIENTVKKKARDK